MTLTLASPESRETLTRFRSKLVRKLAKEHLAKSAADGGDVDKDRPVAAKEPSVAAIADLFGISRQHMGDILKHKWLPSIPLARKMSSTFGISTDALFGQDDEDS